MVGSPLRFETILQLLPDIPEPINLEFTAGGSVSTITFNGDIFIGVLKFQDWTIRANNTDWVADLWSQPASNQIKIISLDNGGDIGASHCQYHNTDDRIFDTFDRPIAAFDIVPTEMLPALTLATFSISTGDTVLTFDGPIDLVDDNKKPWGVRASSFKQTVQTVSQSGANEITLTTNTDGPAPAGDFVSYDLSIITLRSMEGQALPAIIEFPLTLIP